MTKSVKIELDEDECRTILSSLGLASEFLRHYKINKVLKTMQGEIFLQAKEMDDLAKFFRKIVYFRAESLKNHENAAKEFYATIFKSLKSTSRK